MRILVITEHFPYPPIAGTPVRSYNLLSRLAAAGHEVWLASFVRAPGDLEAKRRMSEICRGVVTSAVGRSRAWDRPFEAIRYLLRGRPIELRLYMSRGFTEEIRKLVSSVDFDVVEIIDSYMALYLEALPEAVRRKTVLTFIDVVHSRAERISRLDTKPGRRLRNRIYSRQMRRWEPRYAGSFARCIAVSAADRDLLLSSNPRLAIDLVPNGVDARGIRRIPELATARDLVFVGNMGYRPNIDAVTWFCSEILPLVRREVPEAELWIVGKSPTPEVTRLDGNGVHVTGRVDDPAPFYERSLVSVVPLRGGGGTRLKILEAMAYGRPVVSTSVGCEGLDVVDGRHLLVADAAAAIAAAVLRLMQDEELRRSLADEARQLVEMRYDWDVISSQLLKAYGEVGR